MKCQEQLLLCNPLGTVLTIWEKNNICWERYDELENGTCCLRCRDPSAYFKTKEIDKKPKPLHQMMRYIIGVHFNIIMYYLIPAILHKQAREGKQSSWPYKPAARAREWDSCERKLVWAGRGGRLTPHLASSPLSMKLKWQLISNLRSKRQRFKSASCLHLQHSDSQRQSVIKAAK